MDSGKLFEKISDLIQDLKDGLEVEIRVSAELDTSSGEDGDIITFLDSLPDLENLTQEQLRQLLEECEEKLDQLESEEPDESDEDACDDWEDLYSELEDKTEEIRDLLDD